MATVFMDDCPSRAHRVFAFPLSHLITTFLSLSPYTHPCTHSHTFTHVHTPMHTLTHVHTFTHSCTHPCTRTHALSVKHSHISFRVCPHWPSLLRPHCSRSSLDIATPVSAHLLLLALPLAAQLRVIGFKSQVEMHQREGPV